MWKRCRLARLTTEFIGWQGQIVRHYSGPDQFVTTCIDYGRPAVEDDQLASRLELTAGNAYYEMQDGLARPAHREVPQTPVTNGV